MNGNSIECNTLNPSTTDGQSDSGDFQVIWRNLNYTVHNSKAYRLLLQLQGLKNVPISKQILRNTSGNIRSGELVAFMGPSGAGKSTLLECVVNKRVEGKSGEVVVSGQDLKNIQTSFVAQKNEFHTQFTVRETIFYSARLQCATKAKEGTLEDLYFENGNKIDIKPAGSMYCSIVTDRVIKNLSLNICENNRVNDCSGGQLKRLAIAQEVVAKPRILLLDEPTSGLDSTSCFQLIELLQGLTQQKPKMAILATIHQPSYKLLQLFHKVYVISSNGECIYENKPDKLTNFLSDYGLFCPTNYNPADFIIEVAYGDHGLDVINDLVEEQRNIYDKNFEMPKNSVVFQDVQSKRNFPIFKHIWILCKRNNLRTLRDPMTFGFRFIVTAVLPIFLTTLFGSEIGIRGGCPPKFDSEFEPSQLNTIRSEIQAELETTYHNSGNIFFAAMFVMANTAIPTLLTFPTEMVIFKGEKSNFWYGLPAFYFSKLLGELPLQIMFIFLLWPPIQLFQNQIWEWWRFWYIIVLLFFQLVISETCSNIIGAVCMYNIPASIFLGPSLIIVPMSLLCGFFVKVKSISPIFTVLSYLSYMRFVLEGIFVAIYGFDRCQGAASSLAEGREAFIIWMSAMLGVYDEETTVGINGTVDTNSTGIGSVSEQFVTEIIDAMAGKFLNNKNQVRSSVMNMFAFEDSYLNRAVISSAIYLVVARIIAYIVISFKVRVKK